MVGEEAWRQLQKNAASNIEQGMQVAPHSRCTSTDHQSRKLSKLDQADMRRIAGEVETSS